VFEVNLAELQGGDEEQGYRKFKLVAEDVKGTDILTNFHGMDLTREKINSLIKKWQTLIDAHVEAKTTDGYTLRLVSAWLAGWLAGWRVGGLVGGGVAKSGGRSWLLLGRCLMRWRGRAGLLIHIHSTHAPPPHTHASSLWRSRSACRAR
jgi:hypothetical protein